MERGRKIDPRRLDGRSDSVEVWAPLVRAALRSVGRDALGEPVPGVGSTWPTYLCGELVVKFFGGTPQWREAHARERAAHRVLAGLPSVRAPELLADGALFEDEDAPWPFLVTRRVPGTSWESRAPTRRAQLGVAAELGRQLRRVHELPAEPLPGLAVPEVGEVVAAVRRSSLPARLVEQVPAFLEDAPESEPVFCHADVTRRHLFVDSGRLAGLIDWGDAAALDRHHELAKLHLGVFEGDGELLRAFLAAYGWTAGPDFARRGMIEALRRQATGLRQHRSMDVFHAVARRPGWWEEGSLGRLAEALFAV